MFRRSRLSTGGDNQKRASTNQRIQCGAGRGAGKVYGPLIQHRWTNPCIALIQVFTRARARVAPDSKGCGTIRPRAREGPPRVFGRGTKLISRLRCPQSVRHRSKNGDFCVSADATNGGLEPRDMLNTNNMDVAHFVPAHYSVSSSNPAMNPDSVKVIKKTL
jgi:hypothetical protein